MTFGSSMASEKFSSASSYFYSETSSSAKKESPPTVPFASTFDNWAVYASDHPKVSSASLRSSAATVAVPNVVAPTLHTSGPDSVLPDASER